MSNQDTESRPHAHYFKDVRHLDYIDVYRVIDLFAVEHPAMQHALKKVLAAGERGAKSQTQDAQEAIDSLQRFLEMKTEDNEQCPPIEQSEPIPDVINIGKRWMPYPSSSAQSTILEDGSTLTASFGNPQPLDLKGVKGVKEMKVSGFVDQGPSATEKPWYPDDSREWVEGIPKEGTMLSEWLLKSERDTRTYISLPGARVATSVDSFGNKTVAYKVVK